MKKTILALLALSFLGNAPIIDWETPFEKSKGKKSATYTECITYYRKLQSNHDKIKILTYGKSTAGFPINLIVLDKDKLFTKAGNLKKNKAVLLINNAIHAGEPDGIDASMMLARDLLTKQTQLLNHCVVLIVPIYNIAGALNRNSLSRANQNGPEEYGFRANGQNLDLNRDFIKTDSPESEAFQKLFQDWMPDVFIDTHVSNGADYPYTMTYIDGMKSRKNSGLRKLQDSLTSILQKKMISSGFEMIPYVNTLKETPDSGIVDFYDSPRFATGYSALFQTISYVTETHMLKPYKQRVEATYNFIHSYIELLNNNHSRVMDAVKKARLEESKASSVNVAWQLRTDTFEWLNFKGYQAAYKPSEVHGKERLYYNSTKTWQKDIPYYTTHKVTTTIAKPRYYVLPQAWNRVGTLLKLNGVKMTAIQNDSSLDAEVYYIDEFKAPLKPYEGHYFHQQLNLRKAVMKVKLLQGDFLIPTGQLSDNFLLNVLEPEADDSYFRWNFFDAAMSQKEYFSAYVFEDKAAELLQQNSDLRQQLEEAKKKNPDLANNTQAQLDWVFKNGPWKEYSAYRYPVYRIY